MIKKMFDRTKLWMINGAIPDQWAEFPHLQLKTMETGRSPYAGRRTW
jgi:hypothetical protein